MENESEQPEDDKLTPQEREAQRGRPDGLTFFSEPIPADKRYLGDPEDVAEIVRAFLGGVHEIRSAVHDGALEQQAATDKLDALCRKYTDIFTGKDDAYVAMPFNSNGQLAGFLSGLLGGGETGEAAVTTYLMSVAVQMLGIYDDHQNDKADDEATQFHLLTAIEDTRDAMMGVWTGE